MIDFLTTRRHKLPQLLLLAALLALLVSTCAAQTFTSCNPTQVKCPPNVGLSKSSPYVADFKSGIDNLLWSSVGSGSITQSSATGAAFTISKRFDAPTLETNGYMFFGTVEVHIRAAPGQGIVSCVVLQSDDLDEIDWEWLGGSDKVNEVQTNYFGKGNTTTYDRGGKTAVQDTQTMTHNYTISWSKELITWYIDGNAVRTLQYEDAVGGKNFPQTPVRVRVGSWAGGDPGNAEGTIGWAGGVTDFSKGPFTMLVEKVVITNANPAASYAYGDLSGSFQSINVG
ncbi:concanavalin A-like lectin/glucanase domain-containing protein [Apodospora peruviana]|uniref:Concanavalin A-like lectin/glucanase domain-containing protein n=1 Tax=Apodospora peruviana TaxID=516989 RepID=A0AAE0MA85_9PEZI|nr:concanavalin A-like lectin/glucanase domain-containing protein [Apodospora peruviana]